MSQPPTAEEAARKRVVYDMPGAAGVTIRRDVEFHGSDGNALAMDLYYPVDPGRERPAPVPAVVVVAGYPGEGVRKSWAAASKRWDRRFRGDA